jgi:hypothetical protein
MLSRRQLSSTFFFKMKEGKDKNHHIKEVVEFVQLQIEIKMEKSPYILSGINNS